MKYICMKHEAGMEEIFLFPRWVNHDCMEEVLEAVKDQTRGNWKREFREPISAGFVNSSLECHGNSETLGLDSRGDVDTELLRKHLNP